MHRALAEKNELAAVFLISNGANIHDAPKICDTEVEILDDGEEYETGGYEDSAPKTVEEILAEAASGNKKSSGDNPFGDDEDDQSDNPFGNDSDHDSANPFGNDDSEDEGNPFGDGSGSRKSRSNTGQSHASSRSGYRPKTTMPQVPLHQVAEYGFLLVLNALLDRNVDLNFANENGDTGLVHFQPIIFSPKISFR